MMRGRFEVADWAGQVSRLGALELERQALRGALGDADGVDAPSVRV